MGEGLYANLRPMPYVNSLINLIKSNNLEDRIIFCSSSPEDVIECRVQNLKDVSDQLVLSGTQPSFLYLTCIRRSLLPVSHIKS